MKIVQINTLFAPHRFGGAEVLLERLAGELSARGHRVMVACLAPEAEGRVEAGAQVQAFPLRNLYWPFDGRRRGRFLKAAWHLRDAFGRGGADDIDALLDRERPDVVHTHNLSGFTSAVWQVAERRGIPIVHTIHDYALLCPTATMFRRNVNCAGQCLGCHLLSWPKRENSRAVNAVVGCSRFALKRHLDFGYFPAARSYVIHNGDPRGEGSAAGAPRGENEVLRVGYLGRLAPSKGVEFMLEALSSLVPRTCRLLVAGAGEPAYEATLREAYAPSGVEFLGKVDAAAFLAEIDVLVVPSLWHEPFGLVICEAMSAGVPVVAAAVGGIPELVQHGSGGFLFECEDGQALRTYVENLARDRALHRRMMRQSRENYEQCRFERTVAGYERVYEKTVSREKVHVHG